MEIKSFKSIRSRVTFWFFVLVIITLTVTLFTTYFQRTADIKLEAIEKLTVIRELKVDRIENWLEEIEGNVRIISEDLEIRALEATFKRAKKTEQDITLINNSRRILEIYLKNYPDYSELFIINPDTGIVEISTDESREGDNKFKDDYFIKPLESKAFCIGDVYPSTTLHKPALTFSIPIFCLVHKGEHVTGILAARIDLQNSFYPYLQDITGMGKTGETLIVNKDVIALNELRWQEDAPLKLKIKAQPAILASQGYTGIAEMADYRGEKVLAAYTYIPETGWGFVAKQDLSEIYAPISDMLNDLIFLFVVIAIILFFVSLLLSNSLTKPLAEMASVSQKIQSGDFSARNKMRTNGDEIGYLADSYNKMADAMESKIKIESGRSEISDIISPFQNMKDISEDAINRFMKITESDMYALYLLNEEKSKFELLFSVGIDATLVKSFNAHYREGEFAKAVIEKKISHIKDIPPDTIFKFKTIAGTAIPKEIITIPVIVENQVAGIISLAGLKKYSLETLEILNSSSYAINMLFSNLLANEKRDWLMEEIKEKNVKLQSQTEELQSQSEELQSQSDELSEQNAELEMQKKQVEEADRLKSEFLSNMSHELRTPLNSIMALSRVLIMRIKNKISSEESNYLEIIERNGKNLLSLINDILDLSKIEAGKLDINLHNFSLIPTIENIRDNLLPMAKEKGIEVSVSIPENLPEIQSDSEKIHQILQNIMGNAVKFTEKGSVSINAEADENKVIIKIIDTGIGINKENLPHIFEEFRQVDGSSSRRFEGTGLGLAIAHKLADKLGIKISVKSESGKGSIFTLYVPLKWTGSAESEETVVLSKSWKIDHKEKKVKEILSGEIKERPKILMVEDNKETIIQVKMILEKEGYIVDFAEGGKAALDYVKHTIPDGIILDLMMPEIDGFKVLENIRSTSRTVKIPVLILTAKDLTREDFKKLSANNIQQLLYKGAINKDELIFKTKSMIGNESKDYKKVKEVEKKEIKKDEKPVLSEVKVLPKREGLATILVAEDNPDNMITVEAILKDKYNLIEAVNGEAALNKIKSDLPELVLMDIALPKMDGLMVIKFLKDEETTKNIPVIALTAKAMKGDREKIIASGCDDYISKPIDPKKMLKKIDEWIKKK